MNMNMNASKSESGMFQSSADWEAVGGYGDFVLLHSGAYADTYRARRAGKYFLLKAAKSDNASFVNIIRREFEISAGLDHPNIIAAFTFENIPPLGFCLVMKYVEGKNLDEYLNDNPSAKSKRRILSQLLSAVGYLHSCGIVHNDLKPANILIVPRGNKEDLKLIDFGFSDDEMHYLAKTLGCTPDYASPELLSGQGSVDARSDIYSVGKLIKLLYNGGYSLFWKKCTRLNPRHRFPDADSIARAFRFCRTANVIVVVLTLLGIAASFALPPVVRLVEYNTDVAEAEQLFKDGCAREGVSADNLPQLSLSSYLTIGQDRTTREDSLNRIMTLELDDRIIRRDAVLKIDSLYTAYKDMISREKYRAFGLCDAGHFYRECKELGEVWLDRFVTDDNWHSFYSFSEHQRREYYAILVRMARSLPGYGDLSPEEIKFYDSLAKSGQPFRPYVK